MTEHLPLLPILVEHVGLPLPDGCDQWGMRSVRPDFRSSRDFRWPFPGNWAVAPGPILGHSGPCPMSVGDGLCTGLTAAGMASGGIPAITVLLTAHASADVVGDDANKLRLRRVFVVEVVDLPALARGGLLRGADLDGADLHGAYLRGAYLYGANLRGADLRGADLYGADLYGANLYGADLRGADLYGANLPGADLRGADLHGAYLYGANLHGADLRGADLHGANLYGANLHGWERGPDGIAVRQGAGS